MAVGARPAWAGSYEKKSKKQARDNERRQADKGAGGKEVRHGRPVGAQGRALVPGASVLHRKAIAPLGALSDKTGTTRFCSFLHWGEVWYGGQRRWKRSRAVPCQWGANALKPTVLLLLQGTAALRTNACLTLAVMNDGADFRVSNAIPMSGTYFHLRSPCHWIFCQPNILCFQ